MIVRREPEADWPAWTFPGGPVFKVAMWPVVVVRKIKFKT